MFEKWRIDHQKLFETKTRTFLKTHKLFELTLQKSQKTLKKTLKQNSNSKPVPFKNQPLKVFMWIF